MSATEMATRMRSTTLKSGTDPSFSSFWMLPQCTIGGQTNEEARKVWILSLLTALVILLVQLWNLWDVIWTPVVGGMMDSEDRNERCSAVVREIVATVITAIGVVLFVLDVRRCASQSAIGKL